MKSGQIRQKRITYDFVLVKEFDIQELFISELLVTNECRTLNFCRQ